MAVTPTGHLGKALDNLRTLVANSSTFQTWTGTATTAAAKARIYIESADTGSPTRPFCVVGFGEDFAISKVGGGTGNTYRNDGSLLLWFEGAVSSGNAADSEDAAYEFLNDVDGILSDCQTLSGSGGYINVTEFGLLLGPERSAPAQGETDDYMVMAFSVAYGI